MPPFVLSKVSTAQMRVACGLIKRRWLHGSLKRQVIMMPAMSPWMTEGTITCWKIKEGDAFASGDVLLQIESEIATIDVEAHSPGILGKILLPDGTTNVPVEQVIALVAKDMSELAALQRLSTPILPSFHPHSSPRTTNSPKYLQDQFNASLLLPRKTPALSSRTPSLFEMQTMGYGFRGAHIGCPHGVTPRSDSSSKGVAAAVDDSSSEYRSVEVPPCPSPRIRKQKSLPQVDDQVQIDGAAIRRTIVSNLLSHQSANGSGYFDELVH